MKAAELRDRKTTGRKVLEHVRAVLANAAEDIRTLDAGLIRAGAGGIHQSRIELVACLGAAADIITLVVGAGQGAKDGSIPGWVEKIADQARASLLMAAEDGDHDDASGRDDEAA